MVVLQPRVHADGVHLRLLEIFKSRWGGMGSDNSKTQFAVVLFVGMIVLSLFSEVLNRSPD